MVKKVRFEKDEKEMDMKDLLEELKKCKKEIRNVGDEMKKEGKA